MAECAVQMTADQTEHRGRVPPDTTTSGTRRRVSFAVGRQGRYARNTDRMDGAASGVIRSEVSA